MSNTHLKKISDTDSGMTWISPEINHGDWPFRFMLTLKYTEYWGDDEMLKTVGKYFVDIVAVSTVAAADHLKSAADSMGMTLDQFKALPSESQCEALSEYGIHAPLYNAGGNNMRKLLKAAREELEKIDLLFGFYMDRRVNAVGDTGWDWIAGNLCAHVGKTTA